MKLSKIIYSYITNSYFRQSIKRLTAADIDNLGTISDLEKAKQEADRLHAATNYKYYVISWANGYRAVNMTWVNKMKKAGLLPKNYDWLRLERYSLYITD